MTFHQEYIPDAKLAITFFLLFLFFIIISPVIVRFVAHLYDKLGVYHYLQSTLRGMTDQKLRQIGDSSTATDPKDGEGYFIKNLYVAEYYLLTVIITVGLVFAYNNQLSLGGDAALAFVFSPSPESYLGLAMLVLVLNFSLRISAFSRVKYTHFDMESLNNRIMSFGFSFMLTIYFLFVLGVGINVAAGGLDLTLNTTTNGMFKPLLYTFVLIGSIIFLTLFGEWFLLKGKVPDELKDV